MKVHVPKKLKKKTRAPEVRSNLELGLASSQHATANVIPHALLHEKTPFHVEISLN